MAIDNRFDAMADRIAEAVVAVPGVAFLRPGLTDLLRSSAAARTAERAESARKKRAKSAVRVGRGTASEIVTVDVQFVLRRGHRAVGVTRAVRAAVEETVRARTADEANVQVTVTITVTGLV